MIAFWCFLAITIYLVYEEVVMMNLYLQLRKKSNIKSAEMSSIVQRHNQSPQYYVKIENDLYKDPLILKTTILSSFAPRMVGRRFEVLIDNKSNYCILKNPFSFLISGLILALQFTILFNLKYLINF